MSRDFIVHHKEMGDMTPDELKEYMDDINDLFIDFIEAAPFVEIGERDDSKLIKLRANVHTGKFDVGGSIFELQMNLHRYQQRHPELGELKLIVSELLPTPDMRSEHFCPVMGVMIKMKYEQR